MKHLVVALTEGVQYLQDARREQSGKYSRLKNEA
jgi:hypothetical protein